MRLVLDEHFSFKIAQQLRKRGCDVVAVAERPELRRMSDEDLLRWAHANERTVVTENVQDFVPIHGDFLNRGEPDSGIVLTSPHRFPRTTSGIGTLVRALAALPRELRSDGRTRSDLRWL